MNFDFFKSKKIVVLALIITSQGALAAKEPVNLDRFPTSVKQQLQALRDVAAQVKEAKKELTKKEKKEIEDAKKPTAATKTEAPTKDLGEVIKAAKCRKTLEQGLREHGYDVIADAFKDVTSQAKAWVIYKWWLKEPYKSKLESACKEHQAHLKSILAL